MTHKPPRLSVDLTVEPVEPRAQRPSPNGRPRTLVRKRWEVALDPAATEAPSPPPVAAAPPATDTGEPGEGSRPAGAARRSAPTRPPVAAASPPRAARRATAVRPAQTPGEATETPRRRSKGVVRFRSLLLGSLMVVNLAGLPYYVLSVPERVVSPLHPWFKPTGYVGQSMGIVAFLLFAYLWLYPVRRRVRWLSALGSMQRWLDYHVVAGLAVPVLAATHAAWRFEGLIGWGYGAMLIVALSGVVGRYLYVHIPRSRSGIELSMTQLAERRARLLDGIAAETGLELGELDRRLRPRAVPAGSGLLGTLLHLLEDDFDRWRAVSGLRRALRRARPRGQRLSRETIRQVVRLARREMSLAQQARMLGATQRLFRFWHVAHRPISVAALVAVLIHVSVAVALGVTWLW